MSSRPFQPAFKIRVYTAPKTEKKTLTEQEKGMIEARKVLDSSGLPFSADENSIDVEVFTKGEVVYAEEASRINTLSFSIDKFADILLYYFHIGTRVDFYGGYYEDDTPDIKLLFSGTVTRVVTNFDDNGRPSFSVTCMAFGFVKFGNKEEAYSYPDEKSPRVWARKPSLSIEDIVRGICNDNGVDCDIKIKEEYSKVRYTKRNQIRQTDMTDWAFLNKLSARTSCTVWTTNIGGRETVHFRSPHKDTTMQSELSFIYPLCGDYKKIVEIPDSAIIKARNVANNRPRMLFDLSIEEDVALADSVTRSAVYFNKETGEQEEVMAEFEVKDGKNYIVFYQLDENKIREVDEKHPEIANKIRHNSPTSLRWKQKTATYDPAKDPETLNYYYKKISRADETVAMFDTGFFGVHVTAKCPLDLTIKSQCAYRLFGVLRYRTMATDETYYLRSLRHIWASDGAWTDLDFML